MRQTRLPFLLLALTGLLVTLPALAVPWAWSDTIGSGFQETAYAMCQTSDGGFLVVGDTNSFGHGGLDGFVVKLGPSGILEWQKAYGGSGDDFLRAALPLQGGGYLLAGYTSSYGAGSADAWLLKIASDGSLVWQQTYGGTDWDQAEGLAQAADGGFVVSGSTRSYGAGGWDFWVFKVGASGAVAWQKILGGAASDVAKSVVPASDGNFIAVGYTSNYGAGNNDVWAVKFDANGNVLWQKAFGGSGVDNPGGITATPDGGALLSCSTQSGVSDVWLVKLSSTGTIDWQKTYGGSGQDLAWAVARCSDGGFLVAGTTYSFGNGAQAWAFKVSSTGTPVWQKAFGGVDTDEFLSCTSTTDGGFALAGYTYNYGAGSKDFYLFKLDANATVGGSCTGGTDTAAVAATPSFTAATTGSPVSDTAVAGAITASVAAGGSAINGLCVGSGTMQTVASADVTSGPYPLTVNFNAAVAGGTAPFTYDWNFGDGAAHGTGKTPSHTYTASGNFTVSLTVTDAASQTATDTHLIIAVTEPYNCTVTCTASVDPSSGIVPLGVHFSSTAVATGCLAQPSVLWNFGDGSTSTLFEGNHDFLSAGTFHWTCTVTADNKTCTHTGTVQVLSGTSGTWIKEYRAADDTAVQVGGLIASPDGSYFMRPYPVVYPAHDSPFIVTKLSQSGGPIWRKVYGAQGKYLYYQDMTGGLNGGGLIQFHDPSYPQSHLLFVDSAGEIIKEVSFIYKAYPTRVFSLSGGGYVIAGFYIYKTSPSFQRAAFLAKYTEDGNLLKAVLLQTDSEWSGWTPYGCGTPTGGVIIKDCEFDQDLNFVQCWQVPNWTPLGDPVPAAGGGYFEAGSIYLGDMGNQSVVLKRDAQGVPLWSTPWYMGFPQSPLSAGPDGGVYAYSYQEVEFGPFTSFLSRFDGQGNILWNRTLQNSSWGGIADSFQQELVIGRAHHIWYDFDSTHEVPSALIKLNASGEGWEDCLESGSFDFQPEPLTMAYQPQSGFDSWVALQLVETPDTLTYLASDYPITASFLCSPGCNVICSGVASPIKGAPPLAVSFTGTVSSGACDGTPTYAWDFGDGTTSTEQNSTHTYLVDGTYTWTFTVSLDGETCSSTGRIICSSPLAVSPTSSPSSGTIPLAVRFSANLSGGETPYSYAWDFQDGSTSTEANPVHLFTETGSYAVALTVEDGTGKTASGTVTVAVGQGSPTDLKVTPTALPPGGAIPLTVQFAANAQGGSAPYTYDWDFGDGSGHSTEASPAHTYTAAGDFTATLFVIDADSHGAVATASIRTAGTLTASALATPTTGYTPFQVIFTSAVEGGVAPYTYAWDFGDGGTSAVKDPWYTYENAGDFSATFTVKDGSGQTYTAAPISLHVNQGLKAIASGAPLAGTAPLSVHFTGSAIGGTPPYGYSWSFGDGGGSSEQSPTHPYGTVGTYQAVLTVTDSQSLTHSSTPITVHSNAPLSIVASATPTVGSVPLAVQFTAVVSGGMGPYSIAWSFGDGTSGSGASVQHSYTTAGLYPVAVTVTDGAGITATDGHISVAATPPLTATVTADPTEGMEPLTVRFGAVPGGGMAPYTYTWNFGDESPTDPRLNPGHTFMRRGDYTVTFTLLDSVGQTLTKEIAIAVGPAQPKMAWRYTADTSLLYMPTVASDGSVFVAGTNENVYGIGPTGNLLWKKKPGGLVMAPMVFDRGVLYFPTSNKTLVAYSAGGGKAWEVKLDANATSSAAVGPCGDIYIGSTDGYLYAASAGGGLKWKFKTAGPIEASPAVGGDGTIYAVSNAGGSEGYAATLYAIYPSGGLKWAASTLIESTVTLPLILDGDDNIYVTDTSSNITVVPPTKTTPPPNPRTYLWKSTGGTASAVIAGGLLVYSDGGSTNTINISDGSGGPWSGASGASVAPAVSADGKAYVIDNNNGYLVALDMADGSLLSTTKLSGAASSAALVTLNRKGRIALIAAGYNVECYDVPRGGASGPWVQYGGTSHHSARRSTQPTAFITTPTNGSQVSGDVNVIYGGTVGQTCDSPKVNFYIEGFKAASSGTSPANFIWFSGASQDGPYTLTAECSDKAGNVVETSLSVTLRNPDPPTYGPLAPIPTFSWQTMGDDKFRVYLSTDPGFETILVQSKTSDKPWLKSPGWTPSKGQWDKVLAAAGPAPVRVYWKAIGKTAGLVHLGSFFITR